jgi:hypothetical protein
VNFTSESGLDRSGRMASGWIFDIGHSGLAPALVDRRMAGFASGGANVLPSRRRRLGRKRPRHQEGYPDSSVHQFLA